MEDPWVSVGGYSDGTMVYSGKSLTSFRNIPYEAMYVFIREGPPAEFDGCLSPTVLKPCENSLTS